VALLYKIVALLTQYGTSYKLALAGGDYKTQKAYS